jgi:hypothetical protein
MLITTLIIAVAIVAMMGVVDPSVLFPPVADARGPGAKDPNARQFVGTGGSLLIVPGLKKVTGVRVGDMAVPMSITEEYPESFDSNGVPKLSSHEVALYQLIQTAHGPALQRSVKSNDGIWQPGVPIWVSGEWETEKATPPAPPKDDKPKDGGKNPAPPKDDKEEGK